MTALLSGFWKQAFLPLGAYPVTRYEFMALTAVNWGRLCPDVLHFFPKKHFHLLFVFCNARPKWTAWGYEIMLPTCKKWCRNRFDIAHNLHRWRYGKKLSARAVFSFFFQKSEISIDDKPRSGRSPTSVWTKMSKKFVQPCLKTDDGPAIAKFSGSTYGRRGTGFSTMTMQPWLMQLYHLPVLS